MTWGARLKGGFFDFDKNFHANYKFDNNNDYWVKLTLFNFLYCSNSLHKKYIIRNPPYLEIAPS